MQIQEPELTEFDTREVFVDLDATQPCSAADTRWNIRATSLPDVIVLPPLADEMVALAEQYWQERKAGVWARILRALRG